MSCGLTNHRHLGRGLCQKCYNKFIESRHKTESSKRDISSRILSKTFLETEYCRNKKSLQDIATYASCSRQYVYAKLKEYGIAPRSKRESRNLALERGKCSFEKIKDHGVTEKVILQKNKVNEDFFKSWSEGMAYVLGIIYTDGSIRPGILRDPASSDTVRIGRLTISQKEPELLKKVLKLMDCDAKLLIRKRQVFKTGIAGQTHYFHINSDIIYDDLIRLGISPHKSRLIEFPRMPDQFVRHFIRGCWDGDGSFYIEKRNNKVRGDYVSGSYAFIKGLVDSLHNSGFKEFAIYKKHKTINPTYHIKVNFKDCIKLFHYFYDSVPSTMYLERKYKIVSDNLRNIE